jgi:drug/metabolite transporter (DMT)-like permease
MEFKLWLVYSLLAGLCWGTYVPLVSYGGRTLGNSYASFLCVGMAYFLIAVLVPIAVLFTSAGAADEPRWGGTGITFATLAGVAGALGALCVIFATKEARVDPSIRLYIAPIIFALAPVLNTVISLFWHPGPTGPFHFGLEHFPGWKFYVGIVLTGLGAALVLYSKEESEGAKGPPRPAVENVSPPQ